MAREDPGYRGSEEGGDARGHTLMKLVQLRWNGHVTRMPDERLSKLILWRASGGKAFPRWPEERLKRHHKSTPKGFQHTTRVPGIYCTGSSKVALPHQKGSGCTVCNHVITMNNENKLQHYATAYRNHKSAGEKLGLFRFCKCFYVFFTACSEITF